MVGERSCDTTDVDDDNVPLLAHREGLGDRWDAADVDCGPFHVAAAAGVAVCEAVEAATEASEERGKAGSKGPAEEVVVLVEEGGQEEGRSEQGSQVPWFKMPAVYVSLAGYSLIACTYSFLDEVRG